MSNLKFTNQEDWNVLQQHLEGGSGERFGFAHTRLLAMTDDGPVLEVVGVELIDDADVDRDGAGWCVSDRRVDRVHNGAQMGGYGLVEFHNHGLSPPAFSQTDESAIQPMAAYMIDLIPDHPYGAGVYANGRVHAEYWIRTGEENRRDCFRSVTVHGNHLRILNAPNLGEVARLVRQEGLLGEVGRDTLGALRVALVGAGGTGSNVALALAYLGVPVVLVLDDDVVEATDLNRLVTAGIADLGASKSLVARRRMREINPQIVVTALPGLTPDGVHSELEDVDIIIGCVDHDGPRDRLNQIAVDNQTPYIDIATGVDMTTTPPATGGRVIFVGLDGPCLHCLGELDPEEVGRWTKDEAAAYLDRQHGYGTTEPSPSVIHLNAIAAYSAISELVAWVRGARHPAQYLDIDLSGYLSRSDSPSGTRLAPRKSLEPMPGCIGCAQRYLRS